MSDLADKEPPPPRLRGVFDKDDDHVHPLVNNDIFKACPDGMRFDTKEVETRTQNSGTRIGPPRLAHHVVVDL